VLKATIHASQHPCKCRIARPTLSYQDNFHRIAGRIRRPPTHAELQVLRRNSDECHWYELKDKGWYHARSSEECGLSITTPRITAIKLMRKLGFVLNYAEVRRDFQDPDGSLQKLVRVNFIHRYQRVFYRCRSYEVHYTGKRGSRRNFVDYRKPVKLVSRNALHFECRLRGPALKTAGIATVLDLTSFDFEGFWDKQLIFRTINIKYLDRYLGNRPQTYRLWKRSDGIVQAMMIKTKELIRGDKRDRAFPLRRLQATSQGWKLVPWATSRNKSNWAMNH
jgi:hypothetical protein